MIESIRMVLEALEAYLALGLLFAVALHWRGLGVLDTGSHGAGLGFRLLITPGIVGLWPLLALRWWRTIHGDSFLGGQDAPVSPRRLRAAHALAWKAIAVLMPVTVAAVLWWRPIDPHESGLREFLSRATPHSGSGDSASPSQPPPSGTASSH